MKCATKFDCLNSITGTTKKQTNIAQRVKKKRSLDFYFDYIFHRKVVIDIDICTKPMIIMESIFR